MYDQITKTVESKIFEIEPSLKSSYQINSQLNEKLPIDSLDTMTLLLDLEEEYKIKITEDDFESHSLQNTKNLIQFIEKKITAHS